jgi:c-di-GMP-binding flagellar brake protein YcgR
MQEERRKLNRRLADRELLERVHVLEKTVKHDDAQSKADRRLRRRAIRHNCKVHIGLKVRTSSGNLDTWQESEYSIKGRVLDLSEEGCSLYTLEQVDMGQEMHLAIAMEDKKPISAEGVCRWTKSVPDKGGFASGIQFAAISPKEQHKIGDFLQHLDANIGL